MVFKSGAALVTISTLAVLSVTACGGKDPGTMKTMTQQQASHRVDAYIQRTMTALPPGAELNLFVKDAGSCLDPSDNGPAGRVEPSASYKVTGLDPARYSHYFDDLKTWWMRHDANIHLLCGGSAAAAAVVRATSSTRQLL
jgi:hypothetical protein